jgi:hypothetical protein
LRRNEDYDALEAFDLFLRYGLMRYLFLVAESRNLMSRALNMIATERGSLFLTQRELAFLKVFVLFSFQFGYFFPLLFL